MSDSKLSKGNEFVLNSDLVKNQAKRAFSEELFCQQSNQRSRSEQQTSGKPTSPGDDDGKLVTGNRLDLPTESERRKEQERDAARLKTYDPLAKIETDINDPHWPLALRRVDQVDKWLQEAEIRFGKFDKDRNGFLDRAELSNVNEGWSTYLSTHYDGLTTKFHDKEAYISIGVTEGVEFKRRSVDHLGISGMDLLMGRIETVLVPKVTQVPETYSEARRKQLETLVNDRSIDAIYKKYSGKSGL